jgi:peptidyl-prolyl cis-trans isomerase SurA
MLFSLLAGCGEDLATMQSPVIARVGQTNVTLAQYTDALAHVDQAAVVQNQMPPEQVRQIVYQQLIVQAVFLNEARRAGVGVDAKTAAEVDQAINQNTQPAGKGITFADYQNLAKANNYASFVDIRTDRIRLATLDNYIRTLQVEGAPSKVNLRMIGIAAKGEGDEALAAAKQQIDDLVAQIRAGADFATLARQYSDLEQSKAQGGEIGLTSLDQLPPELSQVLESLPMNQVSDPIGIPGGWILGEVTERITGFADWPDLLQSPAGQAYIGQKMAEYSASGDFEPYMQIEELPLPTIQQ